MTPFLKSVSKFVVQPRSRLLSLPAELRIRIYQYVDLSPLSTDFLSWAGVYFACRQLHCELRDNIRPYTELDRIGDLVSKCTHQSCPAGFVIDKTTRAPGVSWLHFGLLQNVVLHIGLDKFAQHLRHRECSLLSTPYSLFLRLLQIEFTGRPEDCHVFPWGDLKSTADILIAPYVTHGQVNCIRVTFTLQPLGDLKGVEPKTSTLENTFKKSGVDYQLTIVQNSLGRQRERSYYSATRFKALRHSPTSSRQLNYENVAA